MLATCSPILSEHLILETSTVSHFNPGFFFWDVARLHRHPTCNPSDTDDGLWRAIITFTYMFSHWHSPRGEACFFWHYHDTRLWVRPTASNSSVAFNASQNAALRHQSAFGALCCGVRWWGEEEGRERKGTKMKRNQFVDGYMEPLQRYLLFKRLSCWQRVGTETTCFDFWMSSSVLMSRHCRSFLAVMIRQGTSTS